MFGAVDIFNLANASFVCISSDKGQESENDVGEDELGEYIEETDHVFNRVINASVTYQARTINDALTFPSLTLGDTVEGHTITAARIEMDNKTRLRLIIEGHEHVDGENDHLANTHQVTFPTITHGFGCSLLVGGNIPEAGIQRATWGISINHVDEDGNMGDQYLGRSQGVRIETTLEAVSDVDPEVGSEWKLDSFQHPRVNNVLYKVSLAAHRVLANAAV